ncbi:MAG: hypothetical protein N4A68_01830 [Maledivibacter sp.]|nr:hypothetical protein [Maledivibacter sp.]
MSNSYTNKYEILRTFKRDDRQNVLIGSNKEDSNEVVVINILYKDKVSKVISKSQFPKGLHNLVHLEEEDNDLIVITEYKEGTPLDSYLSYFNTTVKHKINLAYEYMTKIVKYDIFSNSIKKILIDESQVNIKNNELYFSELLFLNNNFSESTDFDIIVSQIGDIIEKIVFSNAPTEDKDNALASQKILEFIHKLKNGDHDFNTIEGVYNGFRKIYIYDLFMGDEYKLAAKENPHVIPLPIGTTDTDIIVNNEISESGENKKANSTHLQENKMLDDAINGSLDYIADNSNVGDSPGINHREVLIGNEMAIDEREEYNDHKKRSRNYIPMAVVGILLALLLSSAIFLYKPVLNTFKLQQKTPLQKPNAYFEYSKVTPNTYYFEDKSKVFGDDNRITEISWAIYKGDEVVKEASNSTRFEVTFENEGEYKVVVSIKDIYNNIDDYSQIIYNNQIQIDELKNKVDSLENLEALNLVYSNKSIVKDYSAFRSGNYSLKLGEAGRTNSEKIIINDIKINDKPIISMWLASSSKENIKISVGGYKNNKLKFQKQLSFTPKEINAWEMIEIGDTTTSIDKIEITFKDFISPIWLDDIQISSYK